MLITILLFQNYSQKLVTYYSQNYSGIIDASLLVFIKLIRLMQVRTLGFMIKDVLFRLNLTLSKIRSELWWCFMHGWYQIRAAKELLDEEPRAVYICTLLWPSCESRLLWCYKTAQFNQRYSLSLKSFWRNPQEEIAAFKH